MPSVHAQPAAVSPLSPPQTATNVASWIAPSSILVRNKFADHHAIWITGAHQVAVLSDGTERWDSNLPLSGEETVVFRDRMATLHPELEIQLDFEREGQLTPDDEGLSRQWPLRLLQAEKAWNVTIGDPALVVAVVDTGVADHPDLRGRLVAGYDFIRDVDMAGDGDGRDGDPTDVGNESSDSSGFHGSHLTGIIAASTGNKAGMAGIDWRCKVQPVRVLGVKRRRGRDSDIAEAIRWAAGLNVPGVPPNPTPARILNLSFGGPGFSRVLMDAVAAARSRDVVIVASAGNNGVDAAENYPAAFEGVIAVAAATPKGQIAKYSNFGPRVDLMAPGGETFLDTPTLEDVPEAIWSTAFIRTPNFQPVFAFAAGTSQAAAHVTGVAALVRAVAPSLPADVIGAILRRAATEPTSESGAGCDRACGAGLLDASRAVTIARDIERATCPEGNCGTNVGRPVALRPEEGCSAAPGARSDRPNYSSAFWAFGVTTFALIVSVHRRKLRRRLRKKLHSGTSGVL